MKNRCYLISKTLISLILWILTATSLWSHWRYLLWWCLNYSDWWRQFGIIIVSNLISFIFNCLRILPLPQYATIHAFNLESAT